MRSEGDGEARRSACAPRRGARARRGSRRDAEPGAHGEMVRSRPEACWAAPRGLLRAGAPGRVRSARGHRPPRQGQRPRADPARRRPAAAHRVPDRGAHRDPLPAGRGRAHRGHQRLDLPPARGPREQRRWSRASPAAASRRSSRSTPDLVIGFSDIQADLAAKLIRANLQVLIFNQRSLAEILDVILLLGRLVGREARAARAGGRLPRAARRRAGERAAPRGPVDAAARLLRGVARSAHQRHPLGERADRGRRGPGRVRRALGGQAGQGALRQPRRRSWRATRR